MDFKKKITPKDRKIVGSIIALTGVACAFFLNVVVGALLIFAGMWIFNPGYKKENEGRKTVPTWLGALIIVGIIVLLFMIYEKWG